MAMTPTSRTRPDLEESDGEGGILLGAAIGLVFALMFGAMQAIEGPAPLRAEQFAGTVMFGLLLATGPLVGLASLVTGWSRS